MTGLDPTFVLSNRLEAGLWAIVSVGFLVATFVTPGPARRDCAVAMVAFLLFGGSDWVESCTGAWWRPWWLLVWKGLCLVVFAVLLYRYVSRRRRARPAKKD